MITIYFLSYSFASCDRYILQDDMCGATPEKLKEYRDILGPVYLTLVDVLMTKSMITVDQSDWSAEDKETFRCYRQVLDSYRLGFRFIFFSNYSTGYC